MELNDSRKTAKKDKVDVAIQCSIIDYNTHSHFLDEERETGRSVKKVKYAPLLVNGGETSDTPETQLEQNVILIEDDDKCALEEEDSPQEITQSPTQEQPLEDENTILNEDGKGVNMVKTVETDAQTEGVKEDDDDDDDLIFVPTEKKIYEIITIDDDQPEGDDDQPEGDDDDVIFVPTEKKVFEVITIDDDDDVSLPKKIDQAACVVRPCKMCGKEAYGYCVYCRTSFYCSIQCQTFDWSAEHFQQCTGKKK